MNCIRFFRSGANLFIATLISTGAVSPLFAETANEISKNSQAASTLLVVIGASGAEPYKLMFQEWAARWQARGLEAGCQTTVIGNADLDPKETDHQRLRSAIESALKQDTGDLWIVLIGHGTFDRREAKFNLRGPDVSAKELSGWLKGATRPMAIMNCATASAPFLEALAGPNRVVIVATKSGSEQNFARFGDFLSRAISDPAADLDKDEQTSLWEAFLAAARRTAEYYSTDGRLLTEHALLDDSGDGLGVRADQFRGLMPIEPTGDGKPLDGQRAHQWHLVRSARDAKLSPDVLKKRNELELAILQLRDRKVKLPREEYFKVLESLLVELAELNEAADKSSAPK